MTAPANAEVGHCEHFYCATLCVCSHSVYVCLSVRLLQVEVLLRQLNASSAIR